MKASELMVGDWVYAIDDNGEKHPCRANSLEYDYTNKRGDFCVDFYGTGYEAEWPDITFNVEPIPITPEILEKNGFERDFEDGSLIWVDEQDVTEIVWVGTILTIHGENGHLELDTCMYVHELQHALRLCGIDKEIDLC